MKSIELSNTDGTPHFIGSWLIEQDPLCEKLIEFFAANSDKHTKGKMAGGLNLESKNSTDFAIRPKDLEQADHEPVRDYLNCLFACYKDYLDQWPFLKTVMTNTDIGSFNIQRYLPGGHFNKVHSERTTLETSHRVLAWMTYLNDVEDGGSTYFTHYDLEVQPRRGLTLIWPAEWTHAHRGNVLNSGEKYIVTGWMHFPPRAGANPGQ